MRLQVPSDSNKKPRVRQSGTACAPLHHLPGAATGRSIKNSGISAHSCTREDGKDFASMLGMNMASFKDYASRLRTVPPPRTLRVLVVDDEEPVRKFVDRVLRDAGYQTTTAGGGEEALAAVQNMSSVDILVTDLMMPQMTGDELARRLRQQEPAVKVLYLTGFSDKLFKEKVTLWQDEAFLDKPCSVQGLRQAVSLLLFGSLETPRLKD